MRKKLAATGEKSFERKILLFRKRHLWNNYKSSMYKLQLIKAIRLDLGSEYNLQTLLLFSHLLQYPI